MPYFRVCPFCGSNLDPGEICDCKTEKDAETAQRTAVRPAIAQVGVNAGSGTETLQTPSYRPQTKVC